MVGLTTHGLLWIGISGFTYAAPAIQRSGPHALHHTYARSNRRHSITAEMPGLRMTSMPLVRSLHLFKPGLSPHPCPENVTSSIAAWFSRYRSARRKLLTAAFRPHTPSSRGLRA